MQKARINQCISVMTIGNRKMKWNPWSMDFAALWRDYFDIESIERVPENENSATIKLDNYIRNGWSGRFIQHKKEKCSDWSAKRRAVWWNIAKTPTSGSGLYTAFDTGLLRPVYGGVRCHRDGTKDNIRLSSKIYHYLTGYYARHRWQKTLVQTIDQIGPRSPQYEVYAEHILKHFNEAIKNYTQYEYEFQNFLQYCATNTFLDKLATELIKNVHFCRQCLFASKFTCKRILPKPNQSSVPNIGSTTAVRRNLFTMCSLHSDCQKKARPHSYEIPLLFKWTI